MLNLNIILKYIPQIVKNDFLLATKEDYKRLTRKEIEIEAGFDKCRCFMIGNQFKKFQKHKQNFTKQQLGIET